MVNDSDSDFNFSSASSHSSHDHLHAVRAVRGNVRHRSVRVPRIVNPFEHDQHSKMVFDRSLREVRNQGAVPLGYGLSPRDEEQAEYNPVELIRVGKIKSMPIALPEEIWRPRMVEWIRGLRGMTVVLERRGIQI